MRTRHLARVWHLGFCVVVLSTSMRDREQVPNASSRASFWWPVLIASFIVLLFVWGGMCIIAGAPQSSNREERLAEKAQQRGEFLEERGDFAGAIKKYQEAHDLDNDVTYLFHLARALDKNGEYVDALAVHDQAIGDGRWWYPYWEKAACIERNEGVAAAAAWLGTVEQEHPEHRKRPHLIGVFHCDAERYEQAVPYLRESLRRVMKEAPYSFDDQQRLVVGESGPTMRDDISVAIFDLELLAECYLKLQDGKKAYEFATKTIAVHQELNKDKMYLTENERRAGNADCRIIRAEVHAKRGEWEAVERELSLARSMRDGYSIKVASEATKRFSARRRKSKRQ